MKYIILVVVVSSLSACADLKYRIKNVNGERTQAQIDKDWKDCYDFSPNKYAFNQCIEKKGYYPEQYTD